MRFAVCVFVAFACSGVFASEPGQPLDCSDWAPVVPGAVFDFPVITTEGLLLGRADLDPAGRQVSIVSCADPSPGPNCNTTCSCNQLCVVVQDPMTGQRTTLAYVRGRCGDPGHPNTSDDIAPDDPGSCFGDRGSCLRYDESSGSLHFSYVSENFGCGVFFPPCSYHRRTTCRLRGLTSLFDVFQTYVPQSSLSIAVPKLPEGMGGAEHFDTYWGNLTHPLDFTQAHPLQCDYPAAAPHVGDYLTVADTVPTPAPGQGVYYVTAATYHGAIRYGRKTVAGHQSGRDPALLPACVQP